MAPAAWGASGARLQRLHDAVHKAHPCRVGHLPWSQGLGAHNNPGRHDGQARGRHHLMTEASSGGRRSALYEQLPLPGPGSIRLLRLARNTKPSEAVTGQLATFPLGQPSCPPFTTVSYTWGTRYADERIDVSGHQTRVLQNLLPFLRMIGSREVGKDGGVHDETGEGEEKGRQQEEENDKDKAKDKAKDKDGDDEWLWIDSICINQADLAERASQVRLMGQIYRQAARTLVWLGEQTEDTDRAIDFLSLLGQRRKEFREAIQRRRKQIPADLQDHPGWRSVDVLLQNTWWRRVWTLQEFIIPRDLRFHCGPTSLTREAFRQGIDALELFGSFKAYVRSSSLTTAWNRRRIMDWYQVESSRDKMSLVSLMAFCGDYGVTDARDRIWAVHGLAREEDRQMIGRPTYDDDARTLWLRLVRQFVETFSCLDIICFAQLFRSQDPDWPSWAPDWRVPVIQPPLVPLMVSQSTNGHLANFRPVRKPASHKRDATYEASGGERPRIGSWGSPDGYLTCRGLLIDHVDGLGPLPHQPATVVESSSRVNTEATAPTGLDRDALLQSVTRALVLDRMDRFLERAAPVSQYARDFKKLVAACGDQGGRGNASRRLSLVWFRRWWHHNSDPALRIRGCALQELCVPGTGVDDKQPIPTGPRSFLSRLQGTMKAKTRRLMVTTSGYAGMAPIRAQKGDVVCVLFGCNVPVVLRRREELDSQGKPVFEFVGECFVDGFMKGEALQTGMPTQEFAIK